MVQVEKVHLMQDRAGCHFLLQDSAGGEIDGQGVAFHKDLQGLGIGPETVLVKAGLVELGQDFEDGVPAQLVGGDRIFKLAPDPRYSVTGIPDIDMVNGNSGYRIDDGQAEAEITQILMDNIIPFAPLILFLDNRA